jgi:hypothetical protein
LFHLYPSRMRLFYQVFKNPLLHEDASRAGVIVNGEACIAGILYNGELSWRHLP